MPRSKITARFIEPMLLLPAAVLREGSNWSYELKLDGYRALAVKSAGKAHLRSQQRQGLQLPISGLVKALSGLPAETVVDGEVVALDDAGRPSFNALQNWTSAHTPIVYYLFDVLVLGGRDVMSEPLASRRGLLRDRVMPMLGEPVRESLALEASLNELIPAIRAQGLEGLVAKRLDSQYEPGRRSGAWQKMRLNRGQEFVIAGFTPGTRGFDALVFRYFEGGRLVQAGRTRAVSRRQRAIESLACSAG